MRRKIGLCAATLILALATLSSQAMAQDLYDWPSESVPALVTSGDQAFFIGKDKTVYRTYNWRAAKGATPLVLADVTADNKPNLIGFGKPTFVLDHNSDPLWVHQKGCDHGLVADVAADEKRDIVCVSGRSINVYTFDGQLIWSVSGGTRYESCEAGDINGDLKADIECKHRGKKLYSRFDGVSGSPLANGVEEPLVEATEDTGPDPVGASSLKGTESHDLDGDGTAEETLELDGDAVVLKSRSAKKALARIEAKGPISGLVKNLDADGKPEVVILAKDSIHIVSEAGKKVDKFELNTKRYKRAPVGELQSVNAYGFEDDTAAADGVKGLQDDLSKCYASQVRKNQFAGQGLALLEIKVDADGKVKSVDLLHTELADKGVVKCAQGVLKKGTYSKSSEEVSSINVRLFYTFRDQ